MIKWNLKNAIITVKAIVSYDYTNNTIYLYDNDDILHKIDKDDFLIY